jgi:hypothetical protein
MAASMADTSTLGEQESGPPEEVIPTGEAEAIQRIVAAIENRVRDAAAKTGHALRDAHPKAHGCVRAEFRVLDDLPADLRVGIFATPRTYDAWIRFSNGSGTAQKDSIGDGRGMAIKLMGVDASPSTTQDFIMINYPAFFVRNALDYVALEASAHPFSFFMPSLNPFRIRFHEARMALGLALQSVSNPLNIRYWSMTPYRFGAAACKFSARPSGPPSPYVDKNSPDCMRLNMGRHLAAGSAAFDFLVQLRSRPESMPVEDATIVWSEKVSPFVPVARVTIPQQLFDTQERRDFGENLSFTPWHCVDDHRPLGGLNRVRRTVYETISRVRHEMNRTPRQEPSP